MLRFEAGGQGMLVVETIARIRREHAAYQPLDPLPNLIGFSTMLTPVFDDQLANVLRKTTK
jgi:hypothetical protein